MADLNTRNQGIEKFKTNTRIQDGLTSFEVTYNTPLRPDGLVTGEILEIKLYDTITPGETAILSGRIQKITRDYKTSRNYIISGRDGGFQLVRNPYNLDCALNSQTVIYPEAILLDILDDTDVDYGGGNPGFDPEITFHTNGNLAGGYCGIFKSKKKAIDNLFTTYSQMAGLNKIRWYIDSSGLLYWFETGDNRGNVIEYQLNSIMDYIESFTVTDNAENIINQLTVWGCDDTIRSSQRVQASIDQYGLITGDDIKDSSIMTVADAEKRCREELNQKAWPIYTASLVMKKYIGFEVGQQVRFTDLDDYSDIIFTATEKTLEGQPADITSTLQFSTDINAIAPANVADVVAALVDEKVNESKSQMSTVVAVSDDDCSNLLVRPDGSNTLVNASSKTNCAGNN